MLTVSTRLDCHSLTSLPLSATGCHLLLASVGWGVRMDGHREAGAGDSEADTVDALASRPTIYEVARVAGVAPSTVSRALSRPGRVSFKTAEHIRKVAEEIGYRVAAFERSAPRQSTSMLVMVVADITNPVFFGMIR